MYQNEKKEEIVTKMTQIYQELLETKNKIEEKNKELSSLTVGYIDTNINDINHILEEAADKVNMLISEFETDSLSTILSEKKSSFESTRFTIKVTEEEALNAIESSIKSNREIAKLINAEIGKDKAVLR